MTKEEILERISFLKARIKENPHLWSADKTDILYLTRRLERMTNGKATRRGGQHAPGRW